MRSHIQLVDGLLSLSAGSYWFRGVAAALLLSAPAAAAQAQVLEIIVTDPQDRPVAGARGVATCGTDIRTTETDRTGRLVFSDLSEPLPCTLTLAHPGFSDVHLPLTPREGSLRVKLTLAAIAARVEVNGTAPAVSPLRGAASAVLDVSDLARVGQTIDEWLRYARAAAGVSAGGEQISIDGLPGGALPPTGVVRRISVNLDPFSAEFASPGVSQIEIATRTPAPSFEWSLSGSTLGFGGRNPLAPHAPATAHTWGLQASGAGPWQIRALGHASLSRSTQPTAVRTASAPGLAPPEVALPARQGHDVTAMIFRDGPSVEWRATYSRSRSRLSESGAGELTTVEAATDNRVDLHGFRTTISGGRGRISYRGGFAGEASDAVRSSTSTGPSIRVVGDLHTGSAALTRDRDRRRSLTGKAVIEIENGAHPIEAGGGMAMWAFRFDRIPNPHGTRLFATVEDYTNALRGMGQGATMIQTGNGRLDGRNREVYTYGQGYLVRGTRGFARAGLRIDWQTGDAPQWSPRVYSAATLAGGVVASGGAGLFTENWAADLLSTIRSQDARHLRTLIVDGTPRTRVSSIAGDFRRRRELVVRASLARPTARFTPQVEYTFTRGSFLAGSRRHAMPDGWIDELASRERLRRHQLHAALGFTTSWLSLSSHYAWTRSFDGSAGALAIESAGVQTWARSTGLAPWRAGFVAGLRLPGAVSLSILASGEGPTPYDITTNQDVAGDYLFSHRGGRVRNSGRAPGRRSVDVFARRAIRVPDGIPWPAALRQLSANVRVENLFGERHYTSYGPVVGSQLFGQPLAATAGRTVRLSFTR